MPLLFILGYCRFEVYPTPGIPDSEAFRLSLNFPTLSRTDVSCEKDNHLLLPFSSESLNPAGAPFPPGRSFVCGTLLSAHAASGVGGPITGMYVFHSTKLLCFFGVKLCNLISALPGSPFSFSVFTRMTDTEESLFDTLTGFSLDYRQLPC